MAAVQAHYALRMDYEEADRQDLSAWLSSAGGAFLCVFETASGENPHVHAVIYSEKKLAALRKSFQRSFPGKNGNGAYSLKICDDDVDAYMRYMCKGASRDDPPVVLFQQGLDYTPELVEAAHGRYWVNADAIKANKRKRVVCSTIVEELEKLCKDKGVRSRDAIALEYVRLYKDGRKAINIFHGRGVVNTVAVLLDESGDVAQSLAAQIAYQP